MNNDVRNPSDPKYTAEELIEEASIPDEDGIRRQMRRGDESKGDPDERDVAGAIDYEDTPHGQEEIKTRLKSESTKGGEADGEDPQ